MTRLRLGILGSTRGTDMLALIAAIQQKVLLADIVIVISNKADAMILHRAAAAGITTECVVPAHATRAAYDAALTTVLRQHDVDLVVLIGYMRILSAEFVGEWQGKIINVHPSLLPDFAGGMGDDVHQAVLTAGRTETGCTVHIVTETVDAGPILVQKRCAVLPTDTVASLREKVQQLEGDALIAAIQQFS